MVKYKCLRAECPVCKLNGSIQLFLNRNGAATYARTRHYSHLDKQSHKPQFTYCRIENLGELETLIESQGINQSFKTDTGQVGQQQNHDQKLAESSLKSSGRSLVWLGHQPPTLTTRVQIPATALRSKPFSHFNVYIPCFVIFTCICLFWSQWHA